MYHPLTHTTIIEDYEKEILDQILKQINPFSEMTNTERYFVNGMVRYYKPKKILEIGVSAGGGSAILLNAMKDISESKLISVDICNNYYKNQQKPCGFLIKEYFPQFSERWKLYTGKDVSFYIEEIGNNIDLLLIDTAHSHPWETLNFLTVFPYLNIGAWVIVHDISLFLCGDDHFACKYLFDHVTSEKKIRPLSEKVKNIFPNIGAFQICEDTHKYINDVFMSLVLPWAGGVCTVDPKSLSSISSKISKNYTKELSDLFEDAISAQKILTQNRKSVKIERKIRRYLRKQFSKQYYSIKNRLWR